MGIQRPTLTRGVGALCYATYVLIEISAASSGLQQQFQFVAPTGSTKMASWDQLINLLDHSGRSCREMIQILIGLQFSRSPGKMHNNPPTLERLLLKCPKRKGFLAIWFDLANGIFRRSKVGALSSFRFGFCEAEPLRRLFQQIQHSYSALMWADVPLRKDAKGL